ncbi:protein kinase superfamily protein [Actinidia rufa]|uniref:Protein kinase superfamily protein n=1 Tax=Actinidia rufa TaxID=165716 RepID=A0A7J0E125_9ERIC|nr:protein kinase superfamily protein [Actinidia rufa]
MILAPPPCLQFPANSDLRPSLRRIPVAYGSRRVKIPPPSASGGRGVDAFTEYSGYLFELSASDVDSLTEYDISRIASIYRRKPLVVLRRVVQVGATLGKWFALRYLDSVNERSEEMFEVRAAELRKILLQLVTSALPLTSTSMVLLKGGGGMLGRTSKLLRPSHLELVWINCIGIFGPDSSEFFDMLGIFHTRTMCMQCSSLEGIGMGKGSGHGFWLPYAHADDCVILEPDDGFGSEEDLVPPSYLDELSLLQDRITPFSTEVAFNTIEQELGLPIDELFSEVSPEPVAAASLGQVYQARLRRSGQVVAVKVQRPGVQAAISLDILILRFLAGLIRRAGKFNTDLQRNITQGLDIVLVDERC